jgi:DNA-directed RNA polymerase specialized sigma subunit
MKDLDLLKSALSSLKDTFEVLLKDDSTKPKEYKEWSLSKEPSITEASKAAKLMDEHGLNAREAAVHAGIEKENPKVTPTSFSEGWLKHAKEHAANHYAKMESKRFQEAKPEENPLISTQHVTQQLAHKHGQTYGDALKEHLSKPEVSSLSPDDKKKEVLRFKTDFHRSGKSNINDNVKQTRMHEASALADQAANKEFALRNIKTGGATKPIEFESEERQIVPTKTKVSENNPLSHSDVVNYLNHNVGSKVRGTVNRILSKEGRLRADESIGDHEDSVIDGMLRALHTFNPQKSDNFSSHASNIVANLIRQKKDKEQSFLPANLKREMTTYGKGQDKQSEDDRFISTDRSASTAAGIASMLGQERNEDANKIKGGSSIKSSDASLAERSRKWLADLSDDRLKDISEKAKKARDRAQKVKESFSPDIAGRVKAIEHERAIHAPEKTKPFETPDHLYDQEMGSGDMTYGDLIDHMRKDSEDKKGIDFSSDVDPSKLKKLIPQLDGLDLENAPDDFLRILHQHAPNELMDHEDFSRISPEMQQELKSKMGNK